MSIFSLFLKEGCADLYQTGRDELADIHSSITRFDPSWRCNGITFRTCVSQYLLCHFEEKWVLNYVGRPSIWFRYVDDTFTLFESKNNALQFLQYLNSCQVNIKITIEFKENNVIPFLDVLIKRHNHTFSTSIYRKKTLTCLYT